MRVPTITIRRQVLESWLCVEDYSKARLADALQVSRGRVSQLLGAGAEPSAHLIAKLLLLTKLPFERLFQIVSAHEAAGDVGGPEGADRRARDPRRPAMRPRQAAMARPRARAMHTQAAP